MYRVLALDGRGMEIAQGDAGTIDEARAECAVCRREARCCVVEISAKGNSGERWIKDGETSIWVRTKALLEE